MLHSVSDVSGQVAIGHELHSTYRQQHVEVWQRFDARSTWYSTLVGCTKTRHIQAMHDRLQVSARNGTDISVGDVPA